MYPMADGGWGQVALSKKIPFVSPTMNGIHACTRVSRSLTIRSMSTSSMCRAATPKETPAAKGYPFASNALVLPVPSDPRPTTLFKGKSLMEHLHKTVLSEKARQLIEVDFSRRHPNRIRVGSVLTVTLEHPPHAFSGVLIAIKRKGADTSILLRNIVQRTGVEMQFFLNSPAIKNIKVIQRAGGTPPPGEEGVKIGKAMVRSKLYFLRNYPSKMSAISAGITKHKK
jgi:large subunit ribosomal protein L19